MVSGFRTILFASLFASATLLSSIATSHAQCVDDLDEANLTVRVDLTSRGELSTRSAAVSIAGGGETNSLQLSSGEESTLSVSAGLYEYRATAEGFETRSGSLSLCGEASLSIQLIPSRQVVLSGTVYAGADKISEGAKGTAVVLTGHDERNGVIIRETVSDDGTYTIADVPAGFYAVEFELERSAGSGARDELLGLQIPFVDVLDNSQLDVRLVSNFDQGDAELSLACSLGGGRFPSGSGLILSLCTLGFVFWRRRAEP